MEISNNFYNTNNNIFFGNKINWVRQGTLSRAELNLAKKIRSHFDGVSSVYLKMGPDVQSQFKRLHSKLVEVPRLRGYIFETGKNGNRLQLSKTKTGKDSDEILTFTVLDKNNEAKLHFRVSDNGDYYVSDLGFGEENIPNDKLGAMKKIRSAMEILKKYAENFTLVKRMVERKEHGVKTAEQAVKKIKEINDFSGYKEEITTMMKNFKDVNRLLNKNQGQMVECKQEFLAQGDKRTRGWTFRNSDNGNLYTIFPLAQKATNALCRITETSQDGSQKVFVLCSDGKVAIPRDLNPDTLYIRPYNMQFLTEKEAQSNQVKEMISFVDKKISEFERFILEKRNQTPEQKEHRDWRRLIERLLAKEQKAVENKQPKSSEIKTKSTKKKPQQTITEKTPTPVMEKNPKTTVTTPIKETAAKTVTPKIISYTSIESIVNSLNRILDTKPEQRSTHLIHETLPSGKVFGGRFRIKASDGATIIVSRVKSAQFYDFTYLSMKIIKKDGTTHFININPLENTIIESVDGKPAVDKFGRMKNYKNFGCFSRKNEWAKDLPISQYMEEITKTVTEGEPKYIKYVPTQAAKAAARKRAAAARERDALEALKYFNEHPEANLY